MFTEREEARYLRYGGGGVRLACDGRFWTRSDDAVVPMARLNEYFALRRMGRPNDRIFKLILERLDEPVFFPHGRGGRGFLIEVSGWTAERVVLCRAATASICAFEDPEDVGLIHEVVVSTDLEDFALPVARLSTTERYLALAARLRAGLASWPAASRKAWRSAREGGAPAGLSA